MAKILDLQHGGHLPLRHHADIEEGTRNVTYGLRFDKQEIGDAPTVDDIGDLQFYHYWPNIKGQRDMGAWSTASPAVIVKTGALPIRNDTLAEDLRFAPQEITPVNGQLFAQGTPGIVLGAMEEKEEQKLFFASSGPMVAHHLGPNPPTFSAPVYDVDGQGKLDDNRKAGLHSAWWVKFLPNGGFRPFLGQPAIAWNLTQSRGDFTGHGLIVAAADVSIAPPLGQAGRGTTLRRAAIPPADILAMSSASMSGPLHPGHVGDKHQIGVGVDGPLNSAHISTNAYFYRDALRDAPLAFEVEKWPKADDFGFPHVVHRRYDPDANHAFLDGTRKGLWREYVNVPWLVVVPPDNTPESPPTPPDWPINPLPPNNPPPTGPPGGGGGQKPPKEDKGGSGDLGGGNRGPIIVPADPIGGLLGGGVGGSLVGSGPPLTGAGLLGGGGGAKGAAAAADWPSPPYPNLASSMKIQVPGIAGQAHPARTTERFGKHNPRPSDDFVKGIKEKYPITSQIEFFGHERTPGEFVRDTGRDIYPSGTGKGGILISPPQIGLRDYPGNYREQSGITCSTVDVVLHREKVRLFFGTADAAIGEGINGVGVFLNSSQNLQFNGIDELGASDESKFVLFNQQVSVQGSAPNFWIWNTDSGTDVDSGYQLFAGKTASSNRSMRLKMTHHASSLQELGVFDGTTQIAGVTEDSALRLKETSVTPSDVAGWGNFFVKSADSKPYFRDDGGTEYNLTTGSGGDVTGPSSSVDNRIATFDSTTGKIIQDNTGVTVSDTGQFSGVLDIDGGTGNLNITANATGEVTINNAGEDVNFRVEGSTEANLLFVDAGQNFIGIGTNNPSANLHILGVNQPLIHIESTNSIVQTTYEYTDGTNQLFGFLKVSEIGAVLNSCQIELESSLTTTNWEFFKAKAYNSGTQSEFVINDDGADLDFRVEGDTEADLFFVDAGNDRVAIGTNSPDAHFHLGAGAQVEMMWEYVGGNTGYQKGRIVYDDNTALTGGGWVFQDVTDAGAFAANRVSITTQTANIMGVGILNPAYPLDCVGQAHATGFPVSSDKRFKKDVVPLGPVLDKVKKVEGVSYFWNDFYKNSLGRGKEDTGKKFGFLAQDLKKHFPELVGEWKQKHKDSTNKDVDGVFCSVDYDKFTVVLLKAIQELIAKVEKLEAKLP